MSRPRKNVSAVLWPGAWFFLIASPFVFAVCTYYWIFRVWAATASNDHSGYHHQYALLWQGLGAASLVVGLLALWLVVRLWRERKLRPGEISQGAAVVNESSGSNAGVSGFNPSTSIR